MNMRFVQWKFYLKIVQIDSIRLSSYCFFPLQIDEREKKVRFNKIYFQKFLSRCFDFVIRNVTRRISLRKEKRFIDENSNRILPFLVFVLNVFDVRPIVSPRINDEHWRDVPIDFSLDFYFDLVDVGDDFHRLVIMSSKLMLMMRSKHRKIDYQYE